MLIYVHVSIEHPKSCVVIFILQRNFCALHSLLHGMSEQILQLDALAGALKRSGDTIGAQLWLVITKLVQGGLLRSLNQVYIESKVSKEEPTEASKSKKALELIYSARERWLAKLKYLGGSKDEKVICAVASLYRITFEEAPDLFYPGILQACNLLFSFTKVLRFEARSWITYLTFLQEPKIVPEGSLCSANSSFIACEGKRSPAYN